MVRMLAGRLIEGTETEPLTVVVNPVVTYNPSGSPIEFTLKDWNRDFEKGKLTEWTPADAIIFTADPYEGSYCCNLTKTGASIIQTLDEPIPVNAVYEFSCWVKRPDGVSHYTLRMHHTDGTTNDVSGSLIESGWQRVYFDRSEMRTDKILSAISIRSYAGQVFVDKVILALATEVITGAVDASQATPRNLQGEMIARPKGSVLETGSAALNAATWTTVVSYTPDDDYTFELAKILVSCPDDIMYRLRWNGTVISAGEVYVTGGIPFTDWFPWIYYEMEGDGAKSFEIQAISDAGTPTCYAEIVGEDVPSGFNL